MWWNEERDSFLRQNYKTLSARAIAVELHAASRYAIIGRARKLGLAVSKDPTRPSRPSRRRDTAKLRSKSRLAPYIPREIDHPEPLNLSILDVGPGQCRFIAGDDHLCCGWPVKPDKSWCAFHCSVVFEPARNR